MRRLVVMRKLGLVAVALVACGDRAPAPNAPAGGSASSSEPIQGQAAVAPRHAAPACPLAAVGSAAGSGDSEMEPGTTGGPPTYTGWWFDLFRHRELDGLAPNDFIASFFTGDTIAYAGETEPELGVFVVDVGGAPRLTVGPVATAYEYQGPVAKRVDDAAAKDLPAAERAAPWAASYAVAASPEPRMLVKWWPSNGDKALTVQTDAKLGKVTIEPFDHHRVAMTSQTKTVKPGTTSFAIRHKDGDGMEGVHVKVASSGFDGWYELGEVEEGVEVTTGGFAAAGSGDGSAP
jgi:hypothetical protein|nr:hypothetical protein [Kofleriaceae bacterium]